MNWTLARWALEGTAFACLLAAAATDFTDRIVPNRLVLAIMIAGIGMRLMSATSIWWLSVGVWAVTLAVLGSLATRNILGWGDVKLIAAVTLLVPPHKVLPLLVSIALAGGVLACLYLGARRLVRRRHASPLPLANPSRWTALGLLRRESTRLRANEPMPYAVAVLGGVALQTAIETMRCWHVTSR